MNDEIKYIIYGTGRESEHFIFNNMHILNTLVCCFDRKHCNEDKLFHGFSIYSPDSLIDIRHNELIIVCAGDWNTYESIKRYLNCLGYEEFDDFIWCRHFGKKITVVNANCHGPSVINYLNRSKNFRSNYAVYPLDEIHLNSTGEIEGKLLGNIDLYIHQDIRPDNPIGYKLSDEYVSTRLKKDCINITIPNLVGMGVWMYPNLGGLDKVIDTMSGPNYVLYRDYALDIYFDTNNKDNISFEGLLEFWNTYCPDNLEEIRNNSLTKLMRRDKNWDVSVYDFVIKNYRKIPCFVDKDHPSIYLMKEIGRQISRKMGINDINDDDYNFTLGIPVPQLPMVKKTYGINYELEEERKRDYLSKEVEDVVLDYFIAYAWWYHEINLSGLRKTEEKCDAKFIN